MRDVLFEKSYKLTRVFVLNFIGGIGWVFGITVGFAILATIVTSLLAYLGGLPVIGDWFAGFILMIQSSIEKKLLNL